MVYCEKMVFCVLALFELHKYIIRLIPWVECGTWDFHIQVLPLPWYPWYTWLEAVGCSPWRLNNGVNSPNNLESYFCVACTYRTNCVQFISGCLLHGCKMDVFQKRHQHFGWPLFEYCAQMLRIKASKCIILMHNHCTSWDISDCIHWQVLRLIAETYFSYIVSFWIPQFWTSIYHASSQLCIASTIIQYLWYPSFQDKAARCFATLLSSFLDGFEAMPVFSHFLLHSC